MNLVEQHLCGTRLSYNFDMVRSDDFAASWEISVKVYVAVDDAGCRRRCEFWKGNGCWEKVGTGRDNPCFLIPWIVTSN